MIRRSLLIPLLLAACAEGSGPPTGPDLLTVVAHAGEAQIAIGNTTVATPPAVRISDANGPRAGVQVEFTVLAGGGAVTEHLVATDQDGIARVGSWKLGRPGTEQLLNARVGLANSSVVFGAQAVTGPYHDLHMDSGLDFYSQVEVGGEVRAPLAVVTVDRGGNPVAGVPVFWTPRAGSGTIEGADSHSGPDGVARIRMWRASTVAGRQTIEVRGGLPHVLPYLMSVTAVPGPTVTIERLSSDLLEAPPGAEVSDPPRIRALDLYGNPIHTRQAIFTVVEGGGSVDNTHQILDANGTAGVMRWTLGPTPGTHRIRVQVDQVFTDFTATANP